MRQGGFSAVAPAGAWPGLAVECREAASEDESYQLDVSPQGARLTARSAIGAMHGMATFAQLMEPAGEGFAAAAIHIEDHPRFSWRGLMLDVSRHWMPVEVVLRNLDAMEAVKLNVFHWHLSDDQGFRVESKLYPKLQQLGSDGHFYTQQEVRQVVAYAAERGIRVIPEFDIPGHTSSWFVGYPELASAPGPYEIQRRWGIFEPAMDPSRESTYQFLDGFLGEMAGLFPDRYFHIGGDEVEDKQWKASAAIQAFARAHGLATSVQLQTYFNQRVQALLQKHGKTMVGWDEVFAPGLEHDAVIQSWRGAEALAAAAKQGYRGILSSGYYLDHLKPASVHYAVDPLAGVPDEVAGRILGGEACMWSEYVSPETVDSRIWPRMAAIAERFWSPREITDVNSMYGRAEAVSRQLDWVGGLHRTNYQPMLERLGGDAPLRILADAVEALGIEGRRDARKYTSLADLNRLVDAARPESETVRSLEEAVRKADLPTLRAAFAAWAENDARFQGPKELAQLSKNLSAVGSIGLRALAFLESGKAVPEKWIAEQERALDAMAAPQAAQAEVTLAAVRPVRRLLGTLLARTEQH
ncbi:Beta-N-acetylhexosaminidase [Candidatus Sulfopaludibacter sp. SbA3]|nr:Beta-N-acetylhexosaminidase [Candidatus Sulfopaludibacter sp. SbA3]